MQLKDLSENTRANNKHVFPGRKQKVIGTNTGFPKTRLISLMKWLPGWYKNVE